MNGRLLLEVHLPATSQQYDVWVSDSLQVKVCVNLLARTLEDLSNGRFRATSDVVLCDYDTGMMFNMAAAMSSLGLRNGSRVMLV